MLVNEKLVISSITKLLAKGVRVVKYTSPSKMLNSIRSVKFAQELVNCVDKEWTVYLIKYRDYTVIVCDEDHVHVLDVANEEEARKLIEELKSLIE